MSSCKDECCPTETPSDPISVRRQFLSDLMQSIQDGKSSETKRIIEQAPFDIINEDPDTDRVKIIGKIAAASKVPRRVEDGLFLVEPPEITYIPPLAWAVFHNKPKATRYFLEKAGARVNNSSTDGRTSLHTAVSKGNWEIMRLLVEEAQADINSPNFAGETPLYFALYYQKEDYFFYLAHRSDAKVNVLTTAGFSLMHMACCKGLLKAVQFIYERHADLADTASDYEGVTPLYLAAISGHVDIVNFLINEAKVSTKDLHAAESRDALFVLVAKRSRPHQQIFCLLMSKGAYETPENLGALLILSVFHGNDVALQSVLSCPQIADVINTAVDSDGVPPLHLAAFHGHQSCVTQLVKAGIDLTRRDKDGESALYYADLGGFDEIADYLREKGVPDS